MENLSIADQKIKDFYLSIDKKGKSISDKKVAVRKLAEQILNDLLLLEGIDVEKLKREGKRTPDYSKKLQTLIKKNRLEIKFKPALFFIWHEASDSSSHSNNDPKDGGEPTYLESMRICIQPIIKKIFLSKGYDIAFLESNKGAHSTKQIENERVITQLNYQERLKKIFLVISILLFISLLYGIFKFNNLKKSYQDIITIQDTINDSRSPFETNSPIDSLTKNSSQDFGKSEMKIEINNKDSAKIDNIINIQKAEKIEL